jgi:hypothetical protein
MSKRVALIAAGAILMVGGGGLSLGGGAVLAIFGTDSSIASGDHAVSTTTSALVTEPGDISAHGADVLGHPTVKITVTGSDKPVFVGVGPTAAVDRYLAGASVETVTDLEVSPFHLTTTRRAGTTRPGSPLDESFWVAKSDGTTATTNWEIRDGSYRVVIMNADGSPDVNVDGRLALRIPHLTAVGAGVLAGGLTVVLIGIVLFVVGLRTKPDAHIGTGIPSPAAG